MKINSDLLNIVRCVLDLIAASLVIYYVIVSRQER